MPLASAVCLGSGLRKTCLRLARAAVRPGRRQVHKQGLPVTGGRSVLNPDAYAAYDFHSSRLMISCTKFSLSRDEMLEFAEPMAVHFLILHGLLVQLHGQVQSREHIANLSQAGGYGSTISGAAAQAPE